MIKLMIFFIVFVSISPSIISQNLTNCERSCPYSPLTQVPYPFGFSSGCQIQLNCTYNGSVLIGEFSVQQINPDDLLVSLPAMCGRQVEALSLLYGEHYAPLSTNAILLEMCTDPKENCIIPATTLQPNFENINCSGVQGGYGNVSCYSGDISSNFLEYENITRMGCRRLFSGFITDIIGDSRAVSVHLQMIKLGWWLKGSCDCSGDADCIKVVSPVDGSEGHRCNCKSGLEGDGYAAGSGCREGKGMPTLNIRSVY
ncbi:hypothetical protein LXL04_007074 [Taraxacum kok-saghyz]